MAQKKRKAKPPRPAAQYRGLHRAAGKPGVGPPPWNVEKQLTQDGREYYPKPETFTPESVFPTGHRYAGKPRCQSWNKNRGDQCWKLPIKGRPTCREHRGNAKAGAEHPNYEGKGRAKYLTQLPERLRADYMDAAQREIALQDEIHLLDMLIGDRVRRLDSDDTAARWKQAGTALDELIMAIRTGNLDGQGKALKALQAALDSGRTDAEARDEIVRLTEQKRKLVETHTRSEEKAGALVNVNQIVLVQDTLVLGIISVIESGVADADLRAALLGGIQKVWTRNALRAGQPADSGGD